MFGTVLTLQTSIGTGSSELGPELGLGPEPGLGLDSGLGPGIGPGPYSEVRTPPPLAGILRKNRSETYKLLMTDFIMLQRYRD